jgi:hypothetical protein
MSIDILSLSKVMIMKLKIFGIYWKKWIMITKEYWLKDINLIDTIEELRAWYIGKRLNEQIIKDKNKEIIRYSKESDKV